MTVALLIEPLSTAVDAKLGRCVPCMRLSATLTASAWTLTALGFLTGVAPWIVAGLASGAGLLSLLSLAHGVAYVVRGPAPAACASCADKAKARRRAARWRRLTAWMRPAAATAGLTQKRGCRSCGKRTSAEYLAEHADELPRADAGLRAIVEASPEFLLLRRVLMQLEPTDSWRADSQSHFVYALEPHAYGEGATALFVARWVDDAPMIAVVVIPDRDGGEARVIDLRASVRP